ncbi:MAG: IS1182 family transposase [Proteobacteria bacterium]|nr:IS1182 family transposase [Pseudomonadota bacterium]
MAKYKRYDYKQMIMLPISLENQLTPGTLEFGIHTVVETCMDLSLFDEKYKNDETGRFAYDPKILLKIVLFAYSRGLTGSRRIEQACRENVIFMALACGQKPDHSTICAFVSSMKHEIMPLFRDVLMVCEEEGLLGGSFFALDGLKLPSNASKEWSGKLSKLQRKKEKLEGKLKRLLEEHEREDRGDDDPSGSGSFPRKTNRDKQIKRIQSQAKRLKKWLQENEAKIGSNGKEITSNVTDNDSGQMITSHGFIQGYNGQALVDDKHQVVVHGEAFGTVSDHEHVEPIMAGAKENMQAIGHDEDYFKGAIFVADTNYHSQNNLKSCQKMELDAYIPDRYFRRRDPRYADQKRYWPKRKKFALEDFHHDEAKDHYVCPNGKRLKVKARELYREGLVYRVYIADKKDCQPCPLRLKCLTGRGAKRKYLWVPIAVQLTNLSRRMAGKVDTEMGRKIYPRRIAIAEPVFANIRTHKRLDRFTLRGKIKVNIQWLLYCMVHNIGKIVNYGVT